MPPFPRTEGMWHRLVVRGARELTDLHTSRAHLMAEVRHRLSEDLIRGASLSQTLREWQDLELSDIRQELRKRYKTDIPVGDRKGWEDYLADRREEIGDIDSRIDRAERRLSSITYRVFGLTRAEISLVEADY